MSAVRLCARPELSAHSYMRTRARAAWLIETELVEALAEALSTPPLAGLPRLVLGEGSNVLFAGDFPGLLIRFRKRGLSWRETSPGVAAVEAAAGERWDRLVRESVRRGLWGLENLVSIPGTVGAAPVQNIGAYGRELHEVLEEVEVFDLEEARHLRLRAEECALGYRSSRFRRASGQNRWLITAIRLRLSREPAPRLHYPGLREMLSALGGREDDPADIARAVAALRRRKLPDPARQPNLGSFFKNPALPANRYQLLRSELPALPGWPQADGTIKVPAAFLIEACGLKTLSGRGCRISPRHALVIVSEPGADGRAVLDLARQVREAVLVRFQVELEPEPTIVGGSWP